MKKVVFYRFTTLISLVIGLLIFFRAPSGSFVRNSVGDLLIVIFLFGFVKTIFPAILSVLVAVLVFVWSIFIEVLQFLHVPDYFNSQNWLVELILGSTFQWLDIVVYLLGLCLILCLENMLTKPNNRQLK